MAIRDIEGRYLAAGDYYGGQMLLAPPDDDPGLTDACGESPGSVCETVWDATGSEGWAKAADWFIGRPLKIVLILIVAFIVARLTRRWVRRGIRRLVMTQRVAGAWALQRVGVDSDGWCDHGSAPRGSGRVDLGRRRVVGRRVGVGDRRRSWSSASSASISPR